jgi:hypothetical protein
VLSEGGGVVWPQGDGHAAASRASNDADAHDVSQHDGVVKALKELALGVEGELAYGRLVRNDQRGGSAHIEDHTMELRLQVLLEREAEWAWAT